MSIFEIIMLVCFGAAWPFSIFKSYHSRNNGAKSLTFLIIVLVGYAAGITHKYLYNFDGVTYLYALNALMVIIDMGLYARNARLAARAANA